MLRNSAGDKMEKEQLNSSEPAGHTFGDEYQRWWQAGA